MALYIGDTLISGTVEGQQLNLPFSLFEYQFTDHLLNNASWLRADTFSWQSGAVYVSAYAKLVEEYATGTTQTEDGITYKLTTNGFKIAEADQENAIASLFNSTGKAWFYILDTANQRFKLPRELPFDGQAKGNGMTLGLSKGDTNYGLAGSDNITYSPRTVTEYGSPIGTSPGTSVTTGNYLIGITTDPTKSGIILNRDDTDSQKYLYFYVGETVNNANLIDAGAVTDFVSSLQEVHAVVETYVNGTSWYRVYDDGWCEQGGRISISQDTQSTVTVLKPFSNTDYTVLITASKSGLQTGGDGNFTVEYTSTSQFKWGNGDDFSGTGIWYVCGYIS